MEGAETPPALPGDNRNALLMAGLRNISVADLGNATIPDYIAGLVGQIGSETKGVSLDLQHQKVVVNYLETRREEVSGVSLDEEMTNLIKFQRAFQAATRMISTIDTLLDDVINLRK
ncbi:MAG: flagellar basal body rod C-terminal domain-containing protein [Candidatus Deferrimicrobiaceae bacterium]